MKECPLFDVVPEKPQNCSILNAIVNDVDDISFELAWRLPHPNGILRMHNITATCISLDNSKTIRKQGYRAVIMPNQSDTYKVTLDGLQKYSECTVYIAGVTEAGVGQFVSCIDSTPLTSIYASS